MGEVAPLNQGRSHRLGGKFLSSRSLDCWEKESPVLKGLSNSAEHPLKPHKSCAGINYRSWILGVFSPFGKDVYSKESDSLLRTGKNMVSGMFSSSTLAVGKKN